MSHNVSGQPVAVDTRIVALLTELIGQKLAFGKQTYSFSRNPAGEIEITPDFFSTTGLGQTPVRLTVVDGNGNIVTGGDITNSIVNTGTMTIQVAEDAETIRKRQLARAQRLLETMPLDELPPAGSLTAAKLPFLQNRRFEGRKQTMLTIARVFHRDRLVVVTGIPGSGKTQLATEFVHHYGKYFEGGVFWLRFSGPRAIQEQIADLGRQALLNLWPAGAEPARLDDQVEAVLDQWRKPLPRLVVFDDCDDRDTLLRILPTTGGSRFLITSHLNEWTLSIPVEIIELEMLSLSDSVALLRSQRPDLAVDDPDLQALAGELGYLPLALDLASNFLHFFRRTESGRPAVYLEQLRQNLREHDSLKGRGTKTLPTGHEPHVWNTFQLNYRPLAGQEPIHTLARHILARLSFFAWGEPVPHALLRATFDLHGSEAELEWEEALNHLLEIGLARPQMDDTIVLHRLLAAYVRSEVSEEVLAKHIQDLWGLAFSINSDPNLLPLLEQLEDSPSHYINILDELFEYYLRQRDGDSAAVILTIQDPFLKRVGAFAKIREHHRSLEEESVIQDAELKIGSLLSLGNVHRWLGEIESAKARYEAASKVAYELEEDNPVAGALLNVSITYLETGELQKAAQDLQLSVKTARATGNDSLEAKGLDSLGLLAYLQGQISQGIQYHRRSAEIGEQTKDPRRAAEIQSRSSLNLGICMLSLGQFDQAGKSLQAALELAQEHQDQPMLASILGNLGEYYLTVGEDTRAEAALRQAILDSRKLGMKDLTANILHSQAEFYNDRRYFSQAGQLAGEALRIAQVVYNPFLLSRAFSALARALLGMGNPSQAWGAAQEAVNFGARIPVAFDHALMLQGIVALHLGDWERAGILFFDAIQQAASMEHLERRNYRAWESKSLALYGQALVKTEDPVSAARQAYCEARQVTSAPGAVRRAVELFRMLASIRHRLSRLS